MQPTPNSDVRGPVLVVEDDDAHARELTAAIGMVPGLSLGPRAESLAALRAIILDHETQAPVLVIVDLHLDDGSAVSALPDLANRWPDARLLVVSSLTDERSVVEAIRRGAHGFIVKSSPTDQLARGIEEVLAGNAPLTPSIARHIVSRLAVPSHPESTHRPALTPREAELLTALAEGCSYGEVAAQFGVSLSTVQSHVRNLYQKLRASSKVEAINRARRHGLLE